jgi:drug/metabolite transporter superfamily protein YnfA
LVESLGGYVNCERLLAEARPLGLAALARSREPGLVRVAAHPAPTAAGRVYAPYGGDYVGVAIGWLMLVDKVRPTSTDWPGVGVCLAGMAIIMFGPRPEA